MATVRKIIRIDAEKCDGCGQCAQACQEGAIRIVQGKAQLVSEGYCDGLGACIGECPQGAIAIEERPAKEFDAKAVERHLAQRQKARRTAEGRQTACGCPGAAARTLRSAQAGPRDAGGETVPSRLTNWPVQLRLAPVKAPYFRGARVLIAADCVPFALADFHAQFLAGRTLLIGCPKLDDVSLYRDKLTQIFAQNDIKSVEVLHMEVPCCFGLVHVVRSALEDSGKKIPLRTVKIGINGRTLEASGAAKNEA